MQTLYGLFLSLALYCCPPAASADEKTVVIGVVLQGTPNWWVHDDIYVMSAYVDFVHASGGLAVPIKIYQDDAYYKLMFKRINGMIMPGGGRNVTNSEYQRMTKLFFDMSMEAKAKGDYFPIWGECLGAEQLLQFLGGDHFIFSPCDAHGYSIPLNLTEDGNTSRLLRGMPEDLLTIATQDNVNVHNHNYCLPREDFEANEEMKKFYRAVAYNHDRNGTEFVSVIEARDYPIYGLAFHPEKPLFIRTPMEHIPHTDGAVRVAQYFGDFLINEGRKNNHSYPDIETLEKELFYNVPRYYRELPNMFEDYYFNFTRPESEWKKFKEYVIYLTRDVRNVTYTLLCWLAFLLVGASLVFLMDYFIGIRENIQVRRRAMSFKYKYGRINSGEGSGLMPDDGTDDDEVHTPAVGNQTKIVVRPR